MNSGYVTLDLMIAEIKGPDMAARAEPVGTGLSVRTYGDVEKVL